MPSTNKQERHIGLDCDGVMYDFVDAARRWVHQNTGRPISELPDATTWNFATEEWGYAQAEFKKHVEAGVAAGHIFGRGKPYPGTRETLTSLSDAGWKLTVVTNRFVGGVDETWVAQLTRNWLTDWDLPVDAVILSADKTVSGAPVFLEDNTDNYDHLAANGVNAVLFNRPWNCDGKERTRIATWGEFENLIKELDTM